VTSKMGYVIPHRALGLRMMEPVSGRVSGDAWVGGSELGPPLPERIGRELSRLQTSGEMGASENDLIGE